MTIMNLSSIDQLLIQTAFCCMSSDGVIHKSEIDLIKSICEESSSLKSIDFKSEINSLVMKINSEGTGFISSYLDTLKKSELLEDEELAIVNIASKVLFADKQLEYSEIKFFKVIRYCLKISDDKILSAFPDIEQFLEKDIGTEVYFDKLVKQFFDVVNLPQFDQIV